MRSTILTIFPHPSERPVERVPRAVGTARDSNVGRPALTGPSGPQRSQALAPATALPSIESVILEKLLDEIEARQLARVQPTYVIEQTPPVRHTAWFRTLWSLLWVSSIVACVFLVKYIDSRAMVSAGDQRQSRSLDQLTATVGEQKKEFSAMADSLQGLAAIVASSSKRADAIPDMLNRLGSDLKQIRPPLVRQPVELPPEPSLPAMIAPLQEADAAAIPMGGHHHPPIEFAVVPPEVVVHHNALGLMDYWLVPRTASGVRTMTKVVPVWQSNAGTFVHHIAEVKDYIVTPSGDWIATPEPVVSQ